MKSSSWELSLKEVNSEYSMQMVEILSSAYSITYEGSMQITGIQTIQ